MPIPDIKLLHLVNKITSQLLQMIVLVVHYVQVFAQLQELLLWLKERLNIMFNVELCQVKKPIQSILKKLTLGLSIKSDFEIF